MRRLTLCVLALATIACVVNASAASLSLASGNLHAGNAAVQSCDSSFTPTYTLSNGTVTSVTVGGIADPACEGGQLSLTLLSGSTPVGSGGPVTVPTDADTVDNSVVVPVSPQPAAPSVNAVRIVVVGP